MKTLLVYSAVLELRNRHPCRPMVAPLPSPRQFSSQPHFLRWCHWCFCKLKAAANCILHRLHSKGPFSLPWWFLCVRSWHVSACRSRNIFPQCVHWCDFKSVCRRRCFSSCKELLNRIPHSPHSTDVSCVCSWSRSSSSRLNVASQVLHRKRWGAGSARRCTFMWLVRAGSLSKPLIQTLHW